jgi:hypothetical protein
VIFRHFYNNLLFYAKVICIFGILFDIYIFLCYTLIMEGCVNMIRDGGLFDGFAS